MVGPFIYKSLIMGKTKVKCIHNAYIYYTKIITFYFFVSDNIYIYILY